MRALTWSVRARPCEPDSLVWISGPAPHLEGARDLVVKLRRAVVRELPELLQPEPLPGEASTQVFRSPHEDVRRLEVAVDEASSTLFRTWRMPLCVKADSLRNWRTSISYMSLTRPLWTRRLLQPSDLVGGSWKRLTSTSLTRFGCLPRAACRLTSVSAAQAASAHVFFVSVSLSRSILMAKQASQPATSVSGVVFFADVEVFELEFG